MPATGGPMPATGGEKVPSTKGLRSGILIFNNGYFCLRRLMNYDIISINDKWCVPPPDGLGRKPTMSKTLTISQVISPGEDRTPVSLLMRAWMLWRTRNVTGWVDRNAARRRLFDHETETLYNDMLQNNILSNVAASKFCDEWVPDIVRRLRGEVIIK